MDGHSPTIPATPHAALVRSGTCISLLPAARKRALDITHRQLFSRLIFCQLVSDIFCNLICILACRINIIAATPKLAVSILVLQFRKLLVNHQTALSFQIPYKTRNRDLWWYFHQHMNMVRADFCLYNFHLFPFTQLAQYFPNFTPLLPIEYFAPIFRRKYDMIFAIPSGMR